MIKTDSGYLMYYEGQDTASNIWRIGLATSPDGITWNKSSANPVLSPGAAGTWDAFEVRYPSVHYDGATYRMWFSKWDTGDNGGFASSVSGEARLNIGYASSADGVNWTPYQYTPSLCSFCISTDTIIASLPIGTMSAWDRPGVGQPWVIKDGTQFKMWYTGGRIHRPQQGSLNSVAFVEGAIGYATNGSAVGKDKKGQVAILPLLLEPDQ